MQGQILQTSNAAPSIDLYFFDADGLPLTTLTHATAGLTLQYARGIAAPVSITLVTQTPTGAYAAGGFCHVAGGKCRLDLPVAATASGIAQVTILASALPTGARFAPFVVALTPDDVTVAGPTAASVATAVWGATTRELTGIAATIREAIADSLLGRNVAGGSNGGRTVSLFFFKGVNRWNRRGPNNNTLDVYGTNDTTVVATETLTLDPSGNVIGSDPT